MTTFDTIVENLFNREQVGQPTGDPGGDTVLGISMAAHPPSRGPLERAFWGRVAELRATGAMAYHIFHDATVRAAAKAIYLASYWYGYRCNELPEPLAVLVFDAVVNQPAVDKSPDEGVIEMLQAAVGAKVDGVLGGQTVACAKQPRTAGEMFRVLTDFSARRARRYAKRSRPEWHKGLFKREHEAYAEALKILWGVK